MTSRSTEGAAWIEVRFARDTDMDFARLDLSERLANLEERVLPAGVGRVKVTPYVPDEFAAAERALMRYTLTGRRTLESLREHLDDAVVPELSQVEGVSYVSARGGRERLLEGRAGPRQDGRDEGDSRRREDRARRAGSGPRGRFDSRRHAGVDDHDPQPPRHRRGRSERGRRSRRGPPRAHLRRGDGAARLRGDEEPLPDQRPAGGEPLGVQGGWSQLGGGRRAGKGANGAARAPASRQHPLHPPVRWERAHPGAALGPEEPRGRVGHRDLRRPDSLPRVGAHLPGGLRDDSLLGSHSRQRDLLRWLHHEPAHANGPSRRLRPLCRQLHRGPRERLSPLAAGDAAARGDSGRRAARRASRDGGHRHHAHRLRALPVPDRRTAGCTTFPWP